MIHSLLYIFLYYNAEQLLNTFYFSNYKTNYYIMNNDLIKNNNDYYNSMIHLSIFIFVIYSIILIKQITYYNLINNRPLILAFIYLKYTMNIILNDNMTINEYIISRNIMWCFATPVMLIMYKNVNNISLKEIKIEYNIIPNILNTLGYRYKNTTNYYYVMGISYILLGIFMKHLYNSRKNRFANIFILIWGLFCALHTIELFNIIDKNAIHYYYLCLDMIGKVTISIIINDYNEREVAIKDIVDLQTLNFISYMVKNIRIYNNENKLLSKNCENFIQYINNLFITKIPENTDLLKKDLLKKILPLGFDKDYIANINNQSGLNAEPEITQINIKPKQYDMVCILFTDIVNYTELARNYSDTIIFQLLNDVYIKFDSIIKKYQHLQKVETIGDAYMVVGDIFRNENNHKVVIKEIILLAFEFISEIKNIQTPDNNKLSIRIGINMGNVSIGILGSEIPRLCVVGNAVNSASRLQSTADIDTIQMSRHIYEQIEEINFDIKFDIIKKENVFLKNIGSVTTYNITPPPIY